ncbi:hypothetical protein PM082_014379 [Marasmius tenuissimus]|nr:hypothetical protein PM082_014379 [Marasmius tenuissimus]
MVPTRQIIQLVVVLMPPAETFPGLVVQQIFTTASIQLVGIYPTLLVVLIYLQWSMWDPTGTLSAQPVSRIASNSITTYEVSHDSKSTLTSKIV